MLLYNHFFSSPHPHPLPSPHRYLIRMVMIPLPRSYLPTCLLGRLLVVEPIALLCERGCAPGWHKPNSLLKKEKKKKYKHRSSASRSGASCRHSYLSLLLCNKSMHTQPAMVHRSRSNRWTMGRDPTRLLFCKLGSCSGVLAVCRTGVGLGLCSVTYITRLTLAMGTRASCMLFLMIMQCAARHRRGCSRSLLTWGIYRVSMLTRPS